MREEETAKKLRKSACLHTGRESKDECTGKVSIKMNLFSSLCGCVPGVITHTQTHTHMQVKVCGPGNMVSSCIRTWKTTFVLFSMLKREQT